MSIVIEGMELPSVIEPETVIDLAEGITGKIYARLHRIGWGSEENWHKVIALPEKHGRLIDGDALMESFADTVRECRKRKKDAKDWMTKTMAAHAEQDFIEAVLRVKAAPTVVPAEGGDK